MILTQRIGDTKTHSVKLAWNGKPFVPGNAWVLLFTAKSSPETQEDAAAAFQKTSGGGGITTTSSTSSVAVLPQDTDALDVGTLYWDIQATRDVEGQGEARTVASGTFVLTRDVSRLSSPTLDVYTVAPPLLFFSYQTYYETTTDNPKLTEAQWVARLGGDNSRQIISHYPPLPSNDNTEPGRTFAFPYEGLEWFDPSDGSTGVWMWLVEGVEATEDDGVFVSQFPTPADTGLPDGAYVDESGNAYVDESGNYYVSE